MNHLKLKETMNQVHIKKDMLETIIQNVNKYSERRQRRAKNLKKATAAAAVFAIILGAAIPIQAGIRYLVKDRMEHIPNQKLKQLDQTLQSQKNIEADQFSREYTNDEKTRMQELEKSYQNGYFPDQTIAQSDSSRQIPKDTLCYITDTGTFHLPKRPLTDEEILQIIDFKYTTDYALTHNSAAQNAKKAQAQKENRLKNDIKSKNGITRHEAEKAAGQYLHNTFGLPAEGMETDFFIDQRPDGRTVYHFSYQMQDDAYMYSYGIDVSAEDGSLIDTSHALLPLKPELPD